jgi:integrase
MPKVLDAFRALHPRWYPFVLTSFLGGLRFGEIAALHRDDLDVKRGLLTVEWAISGGKVAPTKTSKVRHVKVSPALLKALRDHMEAMALDAQAGKRSAEHARITLTLDTYGKHIQRSAHDHVVAAFDKLVK